MKVVKIDSCVETKAYISFNKYFNELFARPINKDDLFEINSLENIAGLGVFSSIEKKVSADEDSKVFFKNNFVFYLNPKIINSTTIKYSDLFVIDKEGFKKNIPDSVINSAQIIGYQLPSYRESDVCIIFQHLNKKGSHSFTKDENSFYLLNSDTFALFENLKKFH